MERDETPEKARLNLFPGFMERYKSSLNEEAANKYGDIAKEVRNILCIHFEFVRVAYTSFLMCH